MEVSFKAASDQIAVVKKISERAQKLGDPRDSMDIEMDVLATSANGCPIDFEKLLGFDDFSFAHDVAGIAKNLNRSTGTLENCFLPRSAR